MYTSASLIPRNDPGEVGLLGSYQGAPFPGAPPDMPVMDKVRYVPTVKVETVEKIVEVPASLSRLGGTPRYFGLASSRKRIWLCPANSRRSRAFYTYMCIE